MQRFVIGLIAIASAVRAADHDRSLDDRLEVEDRDLGQVDDRRRGDRPERAGVGDREGAAVGLAGPQLAAARSAREVADRSARPSSLSMWASRIDRHDQPALAEVDGDPQVHARVAR